MVPTLDDNLVKGAQVWINLGNLICLRHLFCSTVIENYIFFLGKDLFPSHMPSDF